MGKSVWCSFQTWRICEVYFYSYTPKHEMTRRELQRCNGSQPCGLLAMGRWPISQLRDAVSNMPLLSAWPAGHFSWIPAIYRSLINSEAGLVAVTCTFRLDLTKRGDDSFLSGWPDYCRLPLKLVWRRTSWICIGFFRNFQVYHWCFNTLSGWLEQ